VATVLVLGYAAGVLGYALATPELGVRTAFSPVVNHFEKAFYYCGERVRPGDRIIEAADQPVSNWSHLLRAEAHLGERTPRRVAAGAVDPADVRRGQALGDTFLEVEGEGQEPVRVVRLLFERPGEGTGDGKVHAVWCRFMRSPAAAFLPSVLWFFLKIGLFAVGALVLWKRPEDRAAPLFFLFCTLSFGAYLGGYHWGRIVTQPVLVVVFTVCAVLLPAATLHFYLLFPRPKRLLERHPLRAAAAIYGLPVLFLLVLLLDYATVRWLYRPDPGGAADRVGALLDRMRVETLAYFGVAAAWYLASVACLVHSYRHAADAGERDQVRWILFGAVAALAPLGYSLYLALAEGPRFVGGAATWPMFAASACVTVAFTVSITRYRMMQLDQILSAGAAYFLFSVAAGAVYCALMFLGMLLVGSRAGDGPSLVQALWAAATALVLMIAFDLARGRVKAALDRHYRREKHQLDRTWKRMSEAIEQLADPATVARRLLHAAADLLGAPRGAVYLREGDPALYRLAEAVGGPPALAELPPGCPLVEALRARGAVAARASEPADPARRQMQFLQGELAQALSHEGELLGLLVLGPRGQGPYSPEDVNLLAAFAQVAAGALGSAEGRRAIEALNRELQAKVEKIGEQQRRILALQNQLTGRARAPVSAGAPGAGGVGSDRRADGPPPSAPAPVPGMVGGSPQVQHLAHLVRKVAASDSAVLLRGESGTGKELLARALHENSPRAGKPFVTVHCAALSPALLESELFGHVKGAFTNAIRDKVGRFEAAHGGTLFLDEIGDVSPDVQVKLLRVLQEMTFERVGSSEPVRVDVRVIAATHRDLERLIREGRFREDLFYRLNVLPVHVPPLRERAEDVPELTAHFLRQYARRTGKGVVGIDDDALALLKSYPWPGNVRQLENVVERAVVFADGPVVTAGDLPPELLADGDAPDAAAPYAAAASGITLPSDGDAPPGGLAAALRAERAERERREREHLVRALAAAGGNKAEAARALGMARSTLLSRMKRLGLG
jgi:transcriptional regulator with GAF, ATPase, and Fis domain